MAKLTRLFTFAMALGALAAGGLASRRGDPGSAVALSSSGSGPHQESNGEADLTT